MHTKNADIMAFFCSTLIRLYTVCQGHAVPKFRNVTGSVFKQENGFAFDHGDSVVSALTHYKTFHIWNEFAICEADIYRRKLIILLKLVYFQSKLSSTLRY